jgi:dipeptidyl aminopeptidase/acylaminoacyl peptidase
MNYRFSASRLVAGCLVSIVFLPLMTWSGTSSRRMESVSISPDGKVIAVNFVKGKTSHIYLIAVNTGNATRLTHANTGEESSLTFSPDGKHIAYTYFPQDGGPSRIVIGNADGSDPHEWSRSPDNIRDFSPVFSPDNKTMIFARSRFYGSYSPIAQPHHHAWDFYAADLDGTNVRQLTNESFYMASAISVSPDGKSMVAVTEDLDTPRKIAIYSLDHPETPPQLFRPHVPKEADRKNPILNCPNFMPDGKSILFMAASEGRHGYDYDVYRLDLGTGVLESLTKGNGYATDLKVSADGKAAAFLKWRKNWIGELTDAELCLLDLESHRLTLLKVTGLN